MDLYASTGRLDDSRCLTDLANLGINTHGILRISEAETAQATIITDPEGIQFTAFYPGPIVEPSVWRDWLTSIFTVAGSVFIQAPLPANLMLAGMEHAKLLGAQIIWCPGQYADQLSSSDISAMLPFCALLVGNEHEISHLSNAVDLSQVCTIMSAGADPVTISTTAGRTSVQIPSNPNAVDPTGCGDALVAGIAHTVAGIGAGVGADTKADKDQADKDIRGLTNEQLEQAVQCGIEFAQCCIRTTGSQAHSLAAILEDTTNPRA